MQTKSQFKELLLSEIDHPRAGILIAKFRNQEARARVLFDEIMLSIQNGDVTSEINRTRMLLAAFESMTSLRQDIILECGTPLRESVRNPNPWRVK